MTRVQYKLGEGHPYWDPEYDEFYIEFTFAAGRLERLWLEDACAVTDNWSPDLADRADEWAAWHERAEVQAELEAELEEYQRQMEAAYARQQYEDEERRRSSWMPIDGGPWW